MVRLKRRRWTISSHGVRGTFRKKKKLIIITPADVFLCTLSSCPHLNFTTLLRISHKLGGLPTWKLFLRLSSLWLNFCSLFCVLLPLDLTQEWALKGASQRDRQEANNDFVRYYGTTRKVQSFALDLPVNVLLKNSLQGATSVHHTPARHVSLKISKYLWINSGFYLD